MFKQVFSKLFKTSSSNNCANQTTSATSERYDQPQIYSISSCFQSTNVPTGLTSYYNNESQTETNESSNNSVIKRASSNMNTKQYNDSNTRQIYIAPHCIRYTNSTLDDTIYRIDDDSLNEIAAEILDSDNMPPKLQIVHYDGNYFAINNSHLQIYKQLQLSGIITHVQADLINIEAIPVKLRDHLLQTPSHLLELDQIHSRMFLNDEDVLDEENYVETINNNDTINDFSNNRSLNSGSTSSDNETNNSINDSKLVDETYEFGECENCVDDEEDEDDDENGEDKLKFSSSLEKSFYKDLNTEFNLMTTKKIISSELMKLRPPKTKSTKSILKSNAYNHKSGVNNVKKSSHLESTQQIINTITKLDDLIPSKQDVVEDHQDENDKLIESKSTNASDSIKINKIIREIPTVEKEKNEKELECLLETE